MHRVATFGTDTVDVAVFLGRRRRAWRLFLRRQRHRDLQLKAAMCGFGWIITSLCVACRGTPSMAEHVEVTTTPSDAGVTASAVSAEKPTAIRRPSFPATASFATTSFASQKFTASVEGLKIPRGGVAIRFTVPAIHGNRIYCVAEVTTPRLEPAVASLWRPDGTLVQMQNDSCSEDSLGPNNPSCTRSVSCPVNPGRAEDFILVIEANAVPVTVSAGVNAFDPHE